MGIVETLLHSNKAINSLTEGIRTSVDRSIMRTSRGDRLGITTDTRRGLNMAQEELRNMVPEERKKFLSTPEGKKAYRDLLDANKNNQQATRAIKDEDRLKAVFMDSDGMYSDARAAGAAGAVIAGSYLGNAATDGPIGTAIGGAAGAGIAGSYLTGVNPIKLLRK